MVYTKYLFVLVKFDKKSRILDFILYLLFILLVIHLFVNKFKKTGITPSWKKLRKKNNIRTFFIVKLPSYKSKEVYTKNNVFFSSQFHYSLRFNNCAYTIIQSYFVIINFFFKFTFIIICCCFF